MKARNHEIRPTLAHNFDTGTSGRPRRGLILLVAMAVFAMCAASYSQTLIGSPGAGWQSWTAALDVNFNGIDLNNNYAPYWDSPWGASGSYGGGLAEKNAGFCLTSTGDCQGLGSALLAPGAIPFWGQPYNSATDTGGARDNTMYFRSSGARLRATLFLNASANQREINEFGWFETDSTGSTIVARHKLFQGSGEPTGTLKPDPVGKSVLFTPTTYFGYYYSDVSEPTGTPPHGCYAYSIFTLNEPRCTETGGGQGDHDFIVFSPDPGSFLPIYWIVGEDPTDCTNQDGDCNLTVVTITPF
jgi:hypothetical protein